MSTEPIFIICRVPVKPKIFGILKIVYGQVYYPLCDIVRWLWSPVAVSTRISRLFRLFQRTCSILSAFTMNVGKRKIGGENELSSGQELSSQPIGRRYFFIAHLQTSHSVIWSSSPATAIAQRSISPSMSPQSFISAPRFLLMY